VIVSPFSISQVRDDITARIEHTAIEKQEDIMNVGRSAAVVTVAAAVMLALTATHPVTVLAQQDHAHGSTQADDSASQSKKEDANALVKVVRQATERFKNVSVAEAEGYTSQFGCVSGSDFGAMGMHFVNGALVGDGELDPTRPEIVIYEPLPNGRLRLVGADFLVLAADWDAKHAGPPELMGQLFHLFDAPNRFGLPPFYTLHVWAWKDSPTGTFVNWHKDISCDAFQGGR
jgi:hypothetical protein